MTAPATALQRDAQARNLPSGLVLPLPSPLMAALPDYLQGKPQTWFAMPVDIPAVAPGQPGTGQFATDRNHAFVGWYGVVNIRSQDNLTDKSADPWTVSMTDTQNNNYLPQGKQTFGTNLFGTGAANPGLWSGPLVVDPNNGVIVNVTNLHNADTLNFRFAFVGQLVTVS